MHLQRCRTTTLESAWWPRSEGLARQALGRRAFLATCTSQRMPRAARGTSLQVPLELFEAGGCACESRLSTLAGQTSAGWAPRAEATLHAGGRRTGSCDRSVPAPRCARRPAVSDILRFLWRICFAGALFLLGSIFARALSSV